MTPEMELWSPEQELQLLEEMAEREAKAFDMDLGLPAPVIVADAEPTWVAYWNLPQDGIRKIRVQGRAPRR